MTCNKPQAALPPPSPAQDVLYRPRRLAGSTGCGWHGGVDVADGTYVHHQTWWQPLLSGAGGPDRNAAGADQHAHTPAGPRCHDAGPATNPGRGSRRPGPLGTGHQRSTHRCRGHPARRAVGTPQQRPAAVLVSRWPADGGGLPRRGVTLIRHPSTLGERSTHVSKKVPSAADAARNNLEAELDRLRQIGRASCRERV